MNYSESDFKKMVKQTLNELNDCKAKWSIRNDMSYEKSVIICAEQIVSIIGFHRAKVSLEITTEDNNECIKSAILALNEYITSIIDDLLIKVDSYLLSDNKQND